MIDLIESTNRVKTEEARRRVSEIFVNAEVMRLYLFPPEGTTPPKPWDYYPELFVQEMEDYLRQKEEVDLENFKNSRKAYYKEFNDRIGQQ